LRGGFQGIWWMRGRDPHVGCRIARAVPCPSLTHCDRFRSKEAQVFFEIVKKLVGQHWDPNTLLRRRDHVEKSLLVVTTAPRS
jgi:hypothetical protein